MGSHKSQKKRQNKEDPSEKDSDSKRPEGAQSHHHRPIDQSQEKTISPQPEPEGQEQSDQLQDFDSLYLRQVTAEFADDIEKLRKAPDFKEGAVPRLVEALKQGAANFTEEEKRTAMAMANGKRETTS